MKSVEFLKRHREEKSMSWRMLAKKTGVSEAYWFKLIDDGQPPTLERAKQIADVMEMPRDQFVNLVIRDRLLRFLEKEGFVEDPPTKDLRKMIDLLQKWDPEKDSLARYIMSTNSERNGLTIHELANIYIGLGSHSGGSGKQNLTKTEVGKERIRRVKKSAGGGQQRSALFLSDFALVGN